MKIVDLKISNILSFKYYENIEDAPTIEFGPDLNIIIGENGAGKSTFLEVINFIFRRMFFSHVSINPHQYEGRKNIIPGDRRSLLNFDGSNAIAPFRLGPNWSNPNDVSEIKIKIQLDDIDIFNINTINNHISKIQEVAREYSEYSLRYPLKQETEFALTIKLDHTYKIFTIVDSEAAGAGYAYLNQYNFIKEVIELNNIDNPNALIPVLKEAFFSIGSYRNYNIFTDQISIVDESVLSQREQLKGRLSSRSLNANESTEPDIFSLVRLKLAEGYYALRDEPISRENKEKRANNLPLLKKINRRLEIISLKCKIVLRNDLRWSYGFEFVDTKRDKALSSIAELSAGQKSIVHLIFEAYGRGELSGGLMIIDEPEIHLHYQLQAEYMRILEEISKEQKSQYIVVTHSEALINSKTMRYIKRFALDADRSTVSMSASDSVDSKTIIKIIDNTRSTHVFFSSGVILVEGDSDRYFFASVMEKLHPSLSQKIALVDIRGKDEYSRWAKFFLSYGLKTYFICDFDNIFNEFNDRSIVSADQKKRIMDEVKREQLNTLSHAKKEELKQRIAAADFSDNIDLLRIQELQGSINGLLKGLSAKVNSKTRKEYSSINEDIEALYDSNIFILKSGSLEAYTNTPHKKLDQVVSFCENDLENWLASKNEGAEEVKSIFSKIKNDVLGGEL